MRSLGKIGTLAPNWLIIIFTIILVVGLGYNVFMMLVSVARALNG
jgi:hypothetical protein